MSKHVLCWKEGRKALDIRQLSLHLLSEMSLRRFACLSSCTSAMQACKKQWQASRQ